MVIRGARKIEETQNLSTCMQTPIWTFKIIIFNHTLWLMIPDLYWWLLSLKSRIIRYLEDIVKDCVHFWSYLSNGTPLQYSCLENPMDGRAWQAAVHGVAKSQIRLSDFTLSFHFHALEKEMATHSSVLAWSIPGTGEPGGLPSMGLHRVRHD